MNLKSESEIKPVFKTSVVNGETPSGYVRESNGITCHYLDSKGSILHREDGPAYIDRNSDTEIWYSNGEKHRDGDSPAYKAGNLMMWYHHGKRHRLGKPAIKNSVTGYHAYYEHDRLHKIGGPAVIYENGDIAYYYKGNFIVGVGRNNQLFDNYRSWDVYRIQFDREILLNKIENS